MKLSKSLKNIGKIDMLNGDLIYLKVDTIVNYSKNIEFPFKIEFFKKVNNYLVFISDGHLEIYDNNFKRLFKYDNEIIKKYEGAVFAIYESIIYFIHSKRHNNTIDGHYYKIQGGSMNMILNQPNSLYHNLIIVKDRLVFHLKYLRTSNTYEFSNFRYLDIETKETLWEYRCEEGNHIIHRPIVRGDYVYFYEYIEQGFQLPDDSQTLVRLDLQTGEELARVDAMATTTYMEDRGLLVALRPTPRDRVYNRPLLQYCIVELDSMEVKTGKAPHDDIKHNSVDFPHQRAWDGERVYFVSSPLTFNPENKHHPSFGCFNVETLKVEFVQHLPKATGASISQLEAANNQVYVRTRINELFIYEHEQNA